MKQKNKGITLIALVITIIILLILAGVAIGQLIGNGLFEKVQLAKEINNYKSAKEIVEIKLLEIQTKCTEEKKEYTIEEIAKQLKEDEQIVIEKYYNKEIAKIKEGVKESTVNLKAIVVSVDNYQNYKKYKFLIGEKGKIEKVLEGEVTEITKEEDFKEIEKYEKEKYGGKKEENTENQEDVSNEIEEGDSEATKYKKEIAKKLTELGVKTIYKQPIEDFISNIRILADKNYKEGEESDIVKLKSDLISRYEQQLSLAKIEGYENFDEEDFMLGNKNMLWVHTYDGGDIFEMTKLYDKTTGLLNLGILRGTVARNNWTFYNTFDLYAIKRKVIQVQGKNSGFIGESEELEYIRTKLLQILKEYGIEDTEKTAEEMANSIKKIARDKFEEGVSTYKILIQGDLSSRYEKTVSVTQIEGYQNLTIDDFLIVNKNIACDSINDGVDSNEMTKTYDPTIGTLQFGIQKAYSDIWTDWNTYDVFLLKKPVIDLQEDVN